MLEILTADTPNGIKIPIVAEELQIPYVVTKIDFWKNKPSTLLAVNPNGRIPAIVDRADQSNVVRVFESGAIMLYLADTYGGLIPQHPQGRAETLSWLFLQVSGLGPSFGQAGHFLRGAPERLAYPTERFRAEAQRQLSLVDAQLSRSEWINGFDYSIADIAYFSWLRSASYAGLTTEGSVGITNWLQRISERPAVQRALAAMAES